MTHTFITTGKLLASSLLIAMAFSSTAMAQVKSSTSTPQADVGDTIKPANTYGATRSNRSSAIAAPFAATQAAKEGVRPPKASKDKAILHGRVIKNRVGAKASEPTQLKEGDDPLMAGWFMSKQARENVNTMSMDELMNAYGIGEKTAIKILEIRANTPIKDHEDLLGRGISFDEADALFAKRTK